MSCPADQDMIPHKALVERCREANTLGRSKGRSDMTTGLEFALLAA